MKKYRWYPSPDAGPSIFTEADILHYYWDFWSGKMRGAVKREYSHAYGRPELITRANCIDDWIACHWAEEIKDEDTN